MANFGDWMQRTAKKIPGNSFAQTRLGDVLTGGIARAANRDDWRVPGFRSGNTQTSWDDIAGVGTGNSKIARNTARGVGLAFGGYGLGALFGGGGAAAGAGGEAGAGGAGAGAGAGAGVASGSAGVGTTGSGVGQAAGEGAVNADSSPSIMDWINRARQGASLLNSSGGGGGSQQPSGSMNGVRGDSGTSIWSQINLPQERGRRSIDEISHRTTPTAYEDAESLAARGRYGDTNLLHVSDDELNQLGATGKLTKNPSTGLPEAFSLGGMMPGAGNIFGGILGGGMGNKTAGQITDAGNRGVSIGAPLENPQRQQYQQELTGLMKDPSSFLSTDPYIQASKKAIGDQYQANFAKSGNLPFSSVQGSAAMQQMMSQAYNDRIRQLTTLGGFDQGPGYGGNIAYQSGKDAATIGSNAQTGGMNQIFGGLGGMMGGSGSGMGGLFSGFGKLFGGAGGGGGGGYDPSMDW